MKFIEKALYFIIFFTPFSFALNAKEGVDLSFLRVAIVFIFILSIFLISLRYLKGDDLNKIVNIDGFKNKQTYFLIFFLFFAFFSVFWSENSVWSMRKFIFFASIFPVYFLAVYFINSKEKIFKSLRYFVWGGFIASLFGIAQFASQFIYGKEALSRFFTNDVSEFLYGRSFGSLVAQNHSWFVNIGGKDYFRAISSFPDPHTFALYLGLLIPIAFSFFLYKKKNRILEISVLFLMFLSLLFTFSRGGYIGFLVFFIFALILYFYHFKKKINRNTLFGAIAILMISGGIFTTTIFGERFLSSFSMSDVSNNGRLGIWERSLEVFKQNPLLGAGLGSLPIFFQPSLSIKSPINAHNTYLDIASELGIIGLILFLSIFFHAFKNLLENIRHQNTFNYLSIGIFGSILWFLTHSFFETSLFSVPVLTSLSFLLAITTNIKRDHLEAQPPSRR